MVLLKCLLSLCIHLEQVVFKYALSYCYIIEKQNDSLKEEIATLRRGFENLQSFISQNDAQESDNGCELNSPIKKDEALNTLQLYRKFYNDLCSEAQDFMEPKNQL